ncbi:MAG: preprotein translocase subunit SecG [Acholeplasmatales bacterium]|nr:preprotein translocase subunit SecG [Acholeplasmatales bacterium]
MGKYVIDIFICIISILLIIIVMLQSSKDDINDAFNGSKSDLFKEQKVRGIELFMQRATMVIAIIFVVLVITSVAIHTR